MSINLADWRPFLFLLFYGIVHPLLFRFFAFFFWRSAIDLSALPMLPLRRGFAEPVFLTARPFLPFPRFLVKEVVSYFLEYPCSAFFFCWLVVSSCRLPQTAVGTGSGHCRHEAWSLVLFFPDRGFFASFLLGKFNTNNRLKMPGEVRRAVLVAFPTEHWPKCL